MQDLLIIRHAVAYERDHARWPDDDLRPLTKAGRKKFGRVAASLRAILPTPEKVLCSPLTRARETARILRRRAHFPKATKYKALRPEVRTDKLLEELSTQTEQCVAIVGHEPSLSALLTALLGVGRGADRWRIKKGGIVWLRIDKRIGKTTATLIAYLPPSIRRVQ